MRLKALLSLVLIGQPELKKKLAKPAYRAFAERIGMGFHLDHFHPDETKAYIEHRLRVAGRDAMLFDDEALARIHEASDGVPRRINNIASNCLLQGFGVSADMIGVEIVENVVEDLAGFLGSIYTVPKKVSRHGHS